MKIDARKFIDFAKSPVGRYVAGAMLLAAVVLLAPLIRSWLTDPLVHPNNLRITEQESKIIKNPGSFEIAKGDYITTGGKRTYQGSHHDSKNGDENYITNQTTASKPDTATRESVKSIKSEKPKESKNMLLSNLTPLDIYTDKKIDASQAMTKFAPYGRLIPCELVNTIDSANTQTPIIGIVTENVYNDGKLIIPAGTEVHGSARATPIRDHIPTGTSWVLVWRTHSYNNGEELRIKAIALEDGRVPGKEGRKWDLSDGSAGIKGYTIDNRRWTTLKAIALTFIAGAGRGIVKSKIIGLSGGGAALTSGGTFQDALGKGAQKAASLYADLMLSKILKDGFFVRCPAGSTFYLYVEQTIDLRKATIGGSKVEDAENRANNSGTHPYVYTPNTINQQRTALEQQKQEILKQYPQLNSEAGTK